MVNTCSHSVNLHNSLQFYYNELKQVSKVFCLFQSSGDIVDDWLQSKLQSGKTWEGPINCARKTGDFVPLNTRVIPVTDNKSRYTELIKQENKEETFNQCFRMTDQIIYVKDPPPLLREKFYPDSALQDLSSRLNGMEIRKTSIDVTSIISEGN